MTIQDTLRQSIVRECSERQQASGRDLPSWIERGRGQETLEKLIFFTPPAEFSSLVAEILKAAERSFDRLAHDARVRYLQFLADLYIALNSSLTRWNLDKYGVSAASAKEQNRNAAQIRMSLEALAGRAPSEVQELIAGWKKETAARFKAEAAADPIAEANAFVGQSIAEYLDHIVAAVASSNVRRMTEMQFAGLSGTEFSNDYAAFLPYALLLGASFVTSNPVLVDIAWGAAPETWDPVADRLLAENLDADDDQIARLMTAQVVVENMLPLRPIFLLTEGKTGCVCLQVNPNKHGDAAAMIADASYLYERLTAMVHGGVPNVVFKLPGTHAGLEACRALTARGIGVTITVNFGMFQQLPFAQAIKEGHALFSCLVEMNGRLAFPVRDELLAHLDELKKAGIDESQARYAAAWAGIAVAKRTYQLLRDRGYDLAQFKILIASLRVYEGDAFAALPSLIPDITETLGTGIMSIFPDIRRVYDRQGVLKTEPLRVEAPVPDDVMRVLAHSEIFKQAYYVADPKWVAEEGSRFRPATILSLEQEDKTAAWAPIYNTLTQFCKSYDSLLARVQARRGVGAT